MRSSDRKGKEKLAKVVYQQIFASGQPPCHILLRDYARGVIEVAIAQELNLEGIQVKKIRPPYKSEWPIKIPSEKEIDQLQPSETKNRAEKIAISTIFMSVVGSGDFARYVLGSDYISMDWLQREIQQKKPDRPKDIYEKFINNLSPRQNKVFNDYILAANKLTHAEWLTRLSFTDTGKSIKKLKAYLKKAEQDFLKAVRTKKTETFKQIIKPFLLKGKENFEEPHFPVCKAQRWILKRVFELGWSSKLFAQFDWNVERYDSSHRDAGKPERIGKKYQWIAYHEFLAHLADNLVFAGDEEEPYKGPWQISVRNIDPSFTLSETFSDHWANNRVSWWSPQTYDSWYEKRNTVSWLKDCEFLKQLPISPIVQDPKTGIKWFNLECNYSFMETLPPECPPNSRERRYLRIWLKSYLIRKPDIKNFKKWATEQNFFGDWMPSSHDQSEVFFGEFYWSEAFNSFNNSYNHRNSWTSDNNKLPFEVLVTTDNYFSETNCYDCSVDKTINVFLPAQEIFEKMNLSWNGSEGKYFSQEGDLVAFDPSTHENGPQSLLIEEKVFSEFLEKENCALVWTITGEKGVLVGKTPQKKFEGKMEISCFLALQNGKVTGEISPYWVTIGPNKKRMDTFKIEIDKNLACKTKAKKKL
jgi:hypothetical protein